MAEARPLAAPGTLSVGLSFVAGFVDTFAFVALFLLFTAHVTGNFVLIGAQLVSSGPGMVAKLLALPIFMATVAAVCLLVRAYERAARSALTVLLLLQFILLAVFMGAGLARAPFTDADAADAVVTGLLGVAAMAIQNAGARLAFPTLVPTTVMTGNVTQFVIDIVDALSAASPAARTEARARLKRFVPALLAFTVGAIVGAVAFARAGYWGLLLPLATMAGLIVSEAKPRSTAQVPLETRS
jgi:uncharacterized membrane protein YoaK (UPF0700 family)